MTSPIRSTRQTYHKRRHRSEKEKKLELLKRKRAGENIDEVTESSESEQEPVGIYDSDVSGLEVLSEFDDEEEEVAENLVKSTKPKPKTSRLIKGLDQTDAQSDQDEYDQDFIVSDEGMFLYT